MSKKEKLGLDKVVNLINKEFEKTSSQFDKLISDAFKQLDSLQAQIHEPIKKVIDDMEIIREREVKRFQSEFDKRITEFNDLQSQLLEKIGIESKKPTAKDVTKKKAIPKAPAKKAAVKKPAAKKPAAKKPATKTAAKSTAKKPQAKAAAKPAAKKPQVKAEK